jgi:hypothetical protein
MYRLIREGLASGEIRPGIDVAFVNEMLVGPVLARMGSGAAEDPEPGKTSRRIIDFAFGGIWAR